MIWLIPLAIISAVLYRLGGKIETKIRDLGCPLVTILALYLLGLYGISWEIPLSYLPTFLLMFGAMTTYWKKKGTDAGWINWFLHGLFIGLSALPLVIIGVNWYSILIRSVVLGLAMAIWSQNTDKDWLEEGGRGAFVVLSLPILLV